MHPVVLDSLPREASAAAATDRFRTRAALVTDVRLPLPATTGALRSLAGAPPEPGRPRASPPRRSPAETGAPRAPQPAGEGLRPSQVAGVRTAYAREFMNYPG